MTYLVIALAVLREVTSREPQCVVALVGGIVGVVLAMRRRLGRTVVAAAGAGEGPGRRASGAAAASERL